MSHVLEEKKIAISDYKIRYERIVKTYNVANPNNKITAQEFHYAYAVVFTRYFNSDPPKEHPQWFANLTDIDGCGSLGLVSQIQIVIQIVSRNTNFLTSKLLKKKILTKKVLCFIFFPYFFHDFPGAPRNRVLCGENSKTPDCRAHFCMQKNKRAMAITNYI